MTYVFYLRENAKWINGDPVTAQDYVYSYQRAVTPNTITRQYPTYFNPIINSIDIQAGKKSPDTLGVKAIGEYVLQINLAKPNPTFVESLTLDAFKPINKKAVDKYGDAWPNSPKTIISNGAYKLTHWIHNGYVQEVKNENYWNAKNVAIDKVKFLMINDTSSDVQNYSSGNESMTYDSLPQNSNKWYAETFPGQYSSALSLTQQFFIFNMKKEKFKDVRVRKALSMVIDRVGITKGALKQGEAPSYLIVPENIANGRYKDLAKETPTLSWVYEPMDQRIAEARELLKDAGYSAKNPLEVTINFNTSDTNRNLALIIQALWQQAFGDTIDVTVFNEDWKVYLDNLKKGDFDIARMGWIADFNAPNTYTENYTCNGGSNYGKYCNKAADELYKKSIETNNKEEFYKMQAELIKMHAEQYSTIPIFIRANNRLVQEYVKGLDPKHNVLGRHRTNQLSIVHK